MAEALTIPNRPRTQDITDIQFLREKGIELLQKYSGNVWTDYNTHDPGITILEVLCLALAEVGYRSGYDITELLGKRARPGNDGDFLPPETVLPTCPVTLADVRKILLDISGVRNVRLRKSSRLPEFSGLYEADVQLTDDAEPEKAEIEQRIRTTLDRNRQPGQEFVDVRFLEKEYIGFELDLEVGRRVDNSEFFHTVASAIENYRSPSLHFFSADELLAKNLDTTVIFDGPMMKNGFVTTDMLESSRLRRNIYTSDLVSLLMGLRDVKSVRKIIIRDDAGKPYHWSYNLAQDKVPRISHGNTHITIRYKGSPVSSQSLSHMRINRNIRSMPKPFDTHRKISNRLQEDNDRLREYYSIHNDLPDTYGIGEYGLPASSTPHREALAHQLRAYLSFFDQLLSGSFEQLKAARHLLSPVPLRATYTPGDIRHLNGGEYLYKPFVDNYLAEHITISDRRHLLDEWKTYIDDNESVIHSVLHSYLENPTTFLDRRNRALNHLLARYGYDFSFFEYVSGFSDEKLIDYKQELLSALPRNDKKRNISEAPRENHITGAEVPLPGFELRLALLTGIRTTSRKALTPPARNMFTAAGSEGVTVDVEVFGAELDEAIDILMATGGKREMYVAEGSSLLLHDYDLEPRARFTTEANPEALAEKLVDAIRKADTASEGFHFIDHLLLRPSDEMECFGFDVLSGKLPVFTCAPALDRETRNREIENFLAGADNMENYSVVETAMRQFRITYRASDLLRGQLFYSTREDAQAAIGEYVYSFKNTDRETIIDPFTSFRDLFPDTDDPFSGIVTFALPSWPSRFSNKAYRKYIDEVFARETPAHLIVNIRWLGFGQMEAFEDAYAAWLDMTTQAGTGQAEKMRRLTNLLNLLAG